MSGERGKEQTTVIFTVCVSNICTFINLTDYILEESFQNNVIPLSEVTPIYLCSVRTCIYTYTIHHIYHELFICCIVMLTLNECTGKGKSENIHKILSFPGISLTAKCTHNYKHSASYCCSDLYDHHTFVFHHKWHQLITLCTKEQQCPVIQFLWAEGVRSGYVN